MLLLFETAAGYALFKVLKENKLQEAEVSASSLPTASRQQLCSSPEMCYNTSHSASG